MQQSPPPSRTGCWNASVRHPHSNGLIECSHRTLLDEHFRVKGRTTWYESVDQMQTDLHVYPHHYNHERPLQSRMMEGGTLVHIFYGGLVEAAQNGRS